MQEFKGIIERRRWVKCNCWNARKLEIVHEWKKKIECIQEEESLQDTNPTNDTNFAKCY